ncbi:MAG TPA: serine hydrolase domain-containing protein [Pseudoxanthomonas sp.]|nr:serine hydrolase domain-containing protein [Pseudoxanthomonas sp.]
MAAILLLTAMPPTVAAPVDDKRVALATLDGFAQGLELADRFSGVVLVAQDGHIVFEKAYGKLDEKRETPIATNTRFNLASAGKMFTAVAVLQQVAQGKLGLDTSVGEVLKDYPNREFADTVTVRHLLTHTAGAGGIDELFGMENAGIRTRVRSVAQMLALHSDRAPAFPPGSKQEYGNFGHVVLGRMVEILSGEDFESYIQHHVFDPAGMSHTGVVACTDTSSDTARGYATVDGKRVSNCLTQPERGFPAGGEVSTASDMLRFVRALQDGKLLPVALFSEATRTQREFMGLGFFATGYGPDVPKRDFRWGHAGSSDGICTDIRTYPNTEETIIVLSNRDAPACFSVSGFLHEQWNRKGENAN